MAIVSELLSSIRDRIQADIERWTGKAAGTRGDIYYPIRQAMAGVAHGLYRKADHLEKQLLDDTCTDANLVKRANEVGIYRVAASRASGTVTIPGNNGAVLAAESLLTKGDLVYRVTADATVASGTLTAQIRAVETGSAGNQSAGVELSLTETVAGLDTVATVVELAGGSDIETITRLRERLAERKQNPPQGGNSSDYVAWAKAAHSDVTRAWCYSNENGPGTVVVRVTTDDLESPIPSTVIINTVAAHINTQRPAGMRGFSVGALTAAPLNITVTSLTPNTTAVRAAVEAELDDMIRRDATPGGTIKLSRIREAISLATGETDHTINLTADVTCASNELITLGTVSWPS
ncbi:baseplate J/gp47 family protein [Oceanobacter kriegii]|uniref:baseplate J/gp47 family protein n=1 Tax=Oceanobacter kriegii TaxID=64972 RepID=UPI0004020FAA|nr:baseplate J/gp47 family protein [Oceanobacter kriegii]